MLKSEESFERKTEKSKTLEKIDQYASAIDLLLQFVKEHDIMSFIITFMECKITIDGIRDCFRNSGEGVFGRLTFYLLYFSFINRATQKSKPFIQKCLSKDDANT